MRGETRGAGASSQRFRIEGFTLAAAVCFENFVDKPLELVGVCRGGTHPAFVFLDFLQHETREQILTIFGHLLQAFDGTFQRLGHMLHYSMVTISETGDCKDSEPIDVPFV